MKYSTIEKYLQENDNFNTPNNELWLVDNIAIKRFELNKLLPNNFHPKLFEVNELTKILSNFIDLKNKRLIDSFEKVLLINKIVNLPQYKDEFKQISSNIDEVITSIDAVNSFSSYQERYKQIEKNETNSGLFLLKDKIDLLLKLYLEECENNNLIDNIQLNNMILSNEIPKIYNFERIVIYGEFFYIPENILNIIIKFAEKNSKEIVFVSSIDNHIEQFFKDKDFISYQNNLSEFLYQDSNDSISNRLKNFDSNKIEMWKFSDWNDELNYIVREIKKDVLESKISLDEIAIYIPNNDLYFFKVQKVFDDFNLPISTSYADNLSQHPLATFTKWFLNTDFAKSTNFLKLLKSSFTTIQYDDFELLKDQTVIFMEKELNTNLLEIESFDFDWIEKIIIESGIENLNKLEDNHKKLHNYFQRKVHYEAKRGEIDNTSKIELEYLKAYSYFVYFNSKYEIIKSLIPKKSLMRDFTNSLLTVFEYLKVDQKYTKYENENVTYDLPYIRLKEVLAIITSSVEKIDNRKYEVVEFIDIFLKLSQSSFVSKEKYDSGVFVTELPFLSKMNFKRIYQVGMTNKHFPVASSKSIFQKFISKFKPIENRDTQLFTQMAK